ncbi:hypothetical protein WMF26_11460 [Sorangium sp. So ce185]|uniref:hypothetical protein n=1 Tax=Sorangium sp. So ce185 TaxID=3133287 RepID=UPI003F60F26B
MGPALGASLGAALIVGLGCGAAGGATPGAEPRGSGADAPPQNARVALFAVALVDELEAQNANPLQGGGAMDGARSFETRLVNRVNECTAEADTTFRRWASEKSFVLLQRKISRGDLLLHFSKDSFPGLLEFVYNITPENSNIVARATLFYRKLDGAKVHIQDLKPHLTAEDVGRLQEVITQAIDCPGT